MTGRAATHLSLVLAAACACMLRGITAYWRDARVVHGIATALEPHPMPGCRIATVRGSLDGRPITDQVVLANSPLVAELIEKHGGLELLYLHRPDRSELQFPFAIRAPVAVAVTTAEPTAPEETPEPRSSGKPVGGLILLAGAYVLWTGFDTGPGVLQHVELISGLVACFIGAVLLGGPQRRSWTAEKAHELPFQKLCSRCEEVLSKGDGAEAPGLAAAMLAELRTDECPWAFVNTAVNLHIMSGHYREALAAPEQWSAEAQEAGAIADPNGADLVSINLAEALYNLGRVREAWELLADWDLTDRLPIVRHGWLQQRAWIAMLDGRAAEALDLMARVDVAGFPMSYRAEYHFTRAAIFASLGRLDEADQAAARGLEVAQRVSSKRNGVFLQARIAYLKGSLEEAAALFEIGASMRYRGQGGDSLLQMGEVLAKLGRHDDARAAFQMVLDRDPQSAACDVARQRLQELAE